MRSFILASLVLLLSFPVYAQTNQTDLLKVLLDLPAPAPFELSDDTDTVITKDYPEEFFNKNAVPPDNAPIEDILAFWVRYNYLSSNSVNSFKPTEVVVQRIFKEIEKKPDLLLSYYNLLPPTKEYASFIKDYYDKKSAEIERLEKANEDIDEDEEVEISVQEAIKAAEEMAEDGELLEYKEGITAYAITQLKTWLTYNTDYYADELEKTANKIKDQDEYVRNQTDLIALAKFAFDKAEPILERMINDKTQPASATLAKWAYYAHFLKEDDERSASKYRRMLQDVVEDRKAAIGIRDLALDALVLEGDFDGRDDWYLTLLDDETLYDLGSFSGLKTLMTNSPPEKWIPVMINLVGNKSPAIHNAAVRNLVSLLDKGGVEQDKLILKALLPWLSNPNWAKNDGDDRNRLIRAYGSINLPESIPGLISIIQNEKPTQSEYGDNSNTNTVYRPDSNANANTTKVDSMSFGLGGSRTAAVSSLTFYKDPRAIPVLLALLDEITERYERNTVIRAIIESGGYSPSQQLNYIEAFVRKFTSGDSPLTNPEYYYYSDAEGSLTADELIGMILTTTDNPDENLVRLLIERIKTLKKSEPQIASALNLFLQRWKSKVLDIERLNLIGSNTADAETIVKALADREDLVKNYRNQIFAMRGSGGMAGGIAACMLEDKNEVLSAVNSGDVNTKIAGLACARLLRIPMPINAVSSLMTNSNPLLALAAERYLESEDSYEARRLILAKYSGEAKILGARNAFYPNEKANYENLPLSELFLSVNPEKYYSVIDVSDIDKTQDKLRKEVKENAELQGVYAFLKNTVSGHQILRIYKDKAVYSWYEDEARYRERVVSQEELKLIFNYVAKNQIEDMNPILNECDHGCESEEFVMFGRNGGRRIFINSSYGFDQPLFGLRMVFDALEQGESKLHYWLQDKIAGLEVFLDEKNIKAKSLWKDGDDFRVLVQDEKRERAIEKELAKKLEAARNSLMAEDSNEGEEFYIRFGEVAAEIDKQRSERKFESYQWRSVKANKLGERVSQPAEDYSISENGQFPVVEALNSSSSLWNSRTSEFELRTGNYDKEGLFKVMRNGLVSQITNESGYVENPIVSPDGKWAIAVKRDVNYYLNSLYRINLQNGKEFKVELPKSFSASPITFIRSHNKFLIHSPGFEGFEAMPEYLYEEVKDKFTKEEFKNKKSEYFLLDAATGSFKLVKGEFTPLSQITFRNLQKTSNPDEFWAAIYNEKTKETKIGRYNAKTFTFKQEMTIPEINLDSMNIWVDEKEAKLYFIYQGHLLSLPFKKNATTPN